MNNPLIDMILSDKVFNIMSEVENHEQHLSFWSGKARKHAISESPGSEFMRAACVGMVMKHKIAMTESAARNAAAQGIAQAPVEAGSAVVDAVGQANAAKVLNESAAA
jgi:hypothetical protein